MTENTRKYHRDPSKPQNGFKSNRFIAEEVTLLDGTKEVRIRSVNGTFTPDLWDVFLDNYREHGMMKKAAAAAGVSASAVRRVITKHKEFAEACLEAEEEYRDKVVEHVQNLALNGTVRKSYDRQGALISEEQVFMPNIVLAEARRVEEGYRDKREVAMNVSGGVLVAPSSVNSIDDWESKYGDGETVEGTATEVQPEEEEDKGVLENHKHIRGGVTPALLRSHLGDQDD